ncbi:hypothetical protein [Lapidilactobacillus bayanensis]|uniref:hypothetical protein n=1 Tax=Lapidilactobacillus bayanensis TaxID=2485998 RepID=UPI0013DDBAAD|nr:hypothetical protein [Lapidilactobacillus bayanensis]
MAAKEYLAPERSGHCLKPIFAKLSSRQVLFVSNKLLTTISPLSGIYFPSLGKQEGNLCASAELMSG